MALSVSSNGPQVPEPESAAAAAASSGDSARARTKPWPGSLTFQPKLPAPVAGEGERVGHGSLAADPLHRAGDLCGSSRAPRRRSPRRARGRRPEPRGSGAARSRWPAAARWLRRRGPGRPSAPPRRPPGPPVRAAPPARRRRGRGASRRGGRAAWRSPPPPPVPGRAATLGRVEAGGDVGGADREGGGAARVPVAGGVERCERFGGRVGEPAGFGDQQRRPHRFGHQHRAGDGPGPVFLADQGDRRRALRWRWSRGRRRTPRRRRSRRRRRRRSGSCCWSRSRGSRAARALRPRLRPRLRLPAGVRRRRGGRAASDPSFEPPVPPRTAATMKPIAITTSAASSFGVSGFGWRRRGGGEPVAPGCC